MSKSLSIGARLRLMALLVTLTLLGLAVYTAYAYYHASIDQRLSATRAVVEQSVAIARKYDAEAAAGRLPAEAARARAKAEIMAIRYDGQEYVWINDMHPRMVGHPIKPEMDGKDLSENKDPDGKRLFVEFVQTVKTQGSGYVDYLWPKVGSTEPVPKRSYVAGYAPWGWVLGSGLYIDDVRAAAARFAAVSLGIGMLVALVVFGFVAQLTRGLEQRLRTAEEALDAIAAGDLARRIEAGPADEIGRVLRAVERTRTGLATMVGRVRSSTDSIRCASSEIATGNQDLSSRTEATASNLQQTASSMTQLNGAVAQSTQSAHEADRLAGEAATVAARGGSVVARVVETMQEIQASSKRIEEIISVIDGIAFQTNILALNAAVEAARAGEQGRGFAVVASEVRSLAQRSATAAREIKALIGASVERVDSGSRLVEDAGATMAEIVSGVQRVTHIIGEIAAAAGEQSGSIGQIHGAVTDLDRMTQQNAALVEQSAAAAQSLKEQSAQLAEAVEGFRLGAA